MDNYIGMTTLNGKNEGLGSGSTGDQSHKQCSNSESSKSCRCCHRLGSLLCSNLGLSLLILGYSTLGAFLFSQLESLSEKQRINQVIALRNLTVAKLWRITENTNILKEENWTAMTTNEIIKFQKLLYQAFMEGFDGREAINPKADQWSFTGAFLYSITVITTIGYGNIGPRTMEGKMLTILYALLGIPLMILFLSKMGSMLANGLRYFYRSCCSCLPSPSASTLPNSGTLDVLDPVHLSSSSGLLSHHAHHSHHHLHDHYHVHHISLNDIHNNTTGHVALHCNSTSPNTTGTLGIVCKGTPGTTTCYGGSGTCNAITVSGSGGGGGGVALSPTVVSMGNSVGPLGGTLDDSETKICPETEVPEHYTTCGGLLLNRHSHATILRGDTLHHHGDHINATLATCQGDHSDYRYQETNHHHPGSSPCNHLINLTSATNNSNPTSKTNDNQMNNKMCDNNYNSNYYPKTVPITLCCIIIAVYIFAGASVFYLWEGWSYWESVYFCFASISTIGLGQATWVLSDFRNSEKKLILCCLYILFGLSLGAMVFNLYQDHLRRKLSNSKCAKRHSTECPHHLTERELLTATPAPNNPLLGEDDFDV